MVSLLSITLAGAASSRDQPKGSEQDESEAQSFHRMVCTEDGEVVAVGRLHKVDEQTAQVRYMAVSDQWQGHGLGAMVLQQLELVALEQGMQRIILNARDTASGFYQKAGYHYLEPANALFGIAHHRYVKTLAFSASAQLLQQWVRRVAANLLAKKFLYLRICN